MNALGFNELVVHRSPKLYYVLVRIESVNINGCYDDFVALKRSISWPTLRRPRTTSISRGNSFERAAIETISTLNCQLLNCK